MADTQAEIIKGIKAVLDEHQKYFVEFDGGFQLAVAMCYVESSGERFNFNHEPNFQKNIVDPLGIDKEKQFEIAFRSTSWGLFQIMGQVIRENNVLSKTYFQNGKARPIQSEEFMFNVEEQCKLYSRIMKKNQLRYMNSPTKLEDSISAYNAGSAKRGWRGAYKNQEYVDKVNKVLHYIKNANLV